MKRTTNEQQKTPQSGKFRMSNVIPQSERHNNAAPGGRFSLAATNSVRRQSFFKPAAMKDTRPIGSKDFQMKMCARILQFLKDKCGMEETPERLVKQPSKQDFIMLFEAIFQHLDSTFQLGPKIDEEVPQIFRLLGYPTAIKSSTMATIGAAHSLPHLWAALCWLIGYVETVQNIQTTDVVLAEQVDGKVTTLAYMIDINAFKEHYSQGIPITDEFVDGHVERFRAAIHVECGVDGRLKEINAGKENLLQEIEMIRADAGREQVLRCEVESLKSDYQSQMVYLKEVNDTLHQFERAMAEAQEGLRLAQDKKFVIEEQVEFKREQIRRQNEGHGLSGEAARELIQEIKENKDTQTTLQQEMNDIGKELWKEKPRVERLFKQEYDRFHNWHDSMVALERSISVSGVDCQIASVTPPAKDAKELLGLLNGYAKNAIRCVETRISAAEIEVKDIISRANGEIERIRERCADQDGRLNQLQRDEQRDERQRKRDKEDWQLARQKLDVEVENLARDKEMLSDKRHEATGLRHELDMAKIQLADTEKIVTQLKVEIGYHCQQKLMALLVLSDKLNEERTRMEQTFHDVANKVNCQFNQRRNPLKEKNLS